MDSGRRVEPKITQGHHLSRFLSKPAEPLSIRTALRLRRVEENCEPPDSSSSTPVTVLNVLGCGLYELQKSAVLAMVNETRSG